MPQEFTDRPRLLLDESPLLGPAAGRGLGRYVAALSEGLEHLGSLERVSLPPRSGRYAEFLDLLPRARLLGRQADVVITPTAYQATFVRGAWICAVLDVIPLDMPEYRRTGAKAKLFHRLAARADVVLTLSEHAAGRITSTLGVPPARIVVAPLPVPAGVGAEHAKPELPPGLPEDQYLLAQADLRAPDQRKRIDWLVQVAAGVDVPLVLVGDGTKDALEGVHGLGRVDDATWSTLLARAVAFVSTSAYEGQGLPVLEAMSCGCPVVAMDNTAVPEVVGDAGVLVGEGPDALEGLVEACRSLIEDEATRAVLRARGLERAALFNSAAFADRLSVAVAQALASRS